MQQNPDTEKIKVKSKHLTRKCTLSISKRSAQFSNSPKHPKSVSSSKKPKKNTPKVVPKLQISKIFSSGSPRKQVPSSSRTRRKSSKRHTKAVSNPNCQLLLSNSSDKGNLALVPTAKLLQNKQLITEVEKKVWDNIKIPVSPSTILELLPNALTKHEQSEVLGYNDIYSIGIKASKNRRKVDSKQNFGYDDDRGDYKVELFDHIAYRYEVRKILGSGSFGQVLLVHDFKTQQDLALKIIRNKARFHQQAQVEVDILKLLTEKDCHDQYSVVHYIDSFIFRKHMCIIFELLYINLYEFIKTNDFNGLSSSLIRRFANQIVNALKLLARYQIIHCDLKPENILLKQANKSSIKVIDFGSSCFTDKKVYTYIQSRFYRAPEIMLGINYTVAIDMWSLGCILVELHTGYPIFPGESEEEQMACIFEVFGVPTKLILSQATRTNKFFDAEGQPKIFANSRGKIRKPGSRKIENIMKGAESGLIDVVKRCLEWDPKDRITPEELLNHPWMKENKLSMTKNLTRGGSSQPHQGNNLNHCHKFSFEETISQIRPSFLSGSCKNKKGLSFVF